ncbi:MAG TPA: DEAD/DEAH box helicase family protein [Candidatus Mediterraneibacter pullicola]|uniref:DEAD/DEAH box helicase family protein n=1 Tax=Candidatus Mediterraneibacter pullicola TaxID=2838682 RepID=A0A9D2H924_9FIRM|nr:DEAD/DEAH box helicase family protein [Candidatus Mediterraneibacter pullicola]
MSFYTEDISEGYNWRGLERAIARLMEHLGWRDINVIGGAGDKGADVIATRAEGQQIKTWVVQSKAVTGDRYIGPQAINESINALSFYNTNIAAVATNGEFTKTARQRQAQLATNGYTVKLWNGAFIKELIDKMPADHAGLRKLRPYQEDIANKVIRAYDEGNKKAFYIVATGLGKTVIAATIARNLWDRGCRKILVLCHAIDLALQLEQGFWPQITKDVPTSVFFAGLPPRNTEGISFGLYQSLYGYLPGIEPGQFDAVIVDEAHHALAHGFRSCIEHLQPRFLVGMTATPWRGDGQSLASVFGEPVAKVSLVDGMAMGYLSKVDYRILCDNVDWDNMQSLSEQNLSIRDLNKRLFLPQRDEAVIEELKKAIQEVKNPRIAVFSPSIEHSNRFADMLSAAGIPCSALLSNIDKAERRKRLLAFAAGEYQAVCAVDVMNEGIDIPDVNILVFLRATHSRRIFVQQLGRGLRLSEGKDKVIVLDFVSDIRRMAEMVEMNNEGKAKGAEKEVVYLQEGFVSFSDARVENFVNIWLEDVADLSGSDDEVKLTFPEGF